MAKKTTDTTEPTAEVDTTPTPEAPATPVLAPYEPTPKEVNELIERSHKALDRASAVEVLKRNHADAQANG
jgi:hypothetical protein